MILQHIKNTLVFLSWTVTSFLCHHFAKTYLKTDGPDISGVIIVSACQLILCFICLDIANTSGQEGHVTRLIVASGHVVATLATNYSFSLIHASSAMAIKMMEPITSVLLQRLILKTQISYTTVMSLPLIVVGAILFTGNPFQSNDVISGFTFALVSNVALAVRNISMKHMFDQGQTMTLKKSLSTMAVAAVSLPAMLYLAQSNDAHTSKIVYTLLLTSLCHVTYTYISTALVLEAVSVVTHAVLNISKRVSVVMLLCVVGTRVVTVTNLLGLLIAAMGLAVYVLGKKKSPADSKQTKDTKKTNYYLILCLLGCVSVLFVRTIAHTPKTSLTKPAGKVFAENLHVQRGLMINDETNQDDLHKTDKVSNVMVEDKKLQLEPRNLLESEVDQFGYPSESNSLIISQTTMQGVINETQNYHFRFFSKLIGGYKYVILVDIAVHENKGDSAIGVGELALLRRLKKELLFYCSTPKCSKQALQTARTDAMKVGKENVVVLCHGGGNIASYELHDQLRKLVFTVFQDFKRIVFPQSILIRNEESIKKASDLYSKFPNATFILRDHRSFQRAKQHFPNQIKLLAPDMAFEIGHVPRWVDPTYDVVWIKRADSESARFKAKVSDLTTHGMSIDIGDWFYWHETKVRSTMERVKTVCNVGFEYLQRGRVVITDRLHGHIMSILLHIPHVLLDTSDGKVAAYHDSWTKGLENNCVLTAKTPQEAVDKAKLLLDKFQDTLPKIKS